MTASTARLYDRDFVRWTETQAAELRRAAETDTNLPLDWEHVAEKVGDALIPGECPFTVEHALDPDWWPERLLP
jgi:hypothetical protein